MDKKLPIRSICAGALGAWAVAASALSLGPVSGEAVIGRPLELVAPIQRDPLDQGSGSGMGGGGCVSAEVTYGDRVVDSARVRVDISSDSARQLSSARIASSSVVDEPFVTVVLYAGCARQASRRYVLLAAAPGAEPVVLAAASTLGVAGTVRVTPVAEHFLASRAVRPVGTIQVAGAAGSAGPATPSAPRRVAASAREAAPRAGGRLQLAVWDPSSEQLPWLRASTELRTSPTADGARRAAASSLWRALNAQPQDLLRTAERLRGLESEMNSLRGLAARHRAEISSARESLEAAQAQRHTSLVLVTLLALLAGGAAALVWHRTRRSVAAAPPSSWYGGLEPFAEPAVVVDDESPPQPAAAVPPVVEPLPLPLPVATAPPVTVPRAPEVKPRTIFVAAPQAVEPLPFTLTEPHSGGAAAPAGDASDRPSQKVDALHGAQQQSEFFASLGQIDEAVAVLTSYLADSSERPVLAYLEIFRIYHGTGMRVEYEELQSTFRQTFGMDVASFGQYQDDERELDRYLLPVTRIAAAWPSVRSQDIIEELLFKPPATPRDLLSLPAYRELLWLYSLGQELIHNTGSPAGLQLLGDRGLSNDHFILPWTDGEAGGPAELSLEQLDRIDVAPELNAFAVDIDLSAMRGDSRPAGDAVHVSPPEPVPEPAASTPANPDVDAFDMAMASQSRRQSR